MPPPLPSIDETVDAWCARDLALAFLPADRAAVESTRGPRALVVERLREGAGDRDLFHACAVLGRVLAESGASPSLTAGTIDAVRESLPEVGDARTRAARAALFEGYVVARSESALAAAAARWEYPGCAVPLENASVAIAGGFPDEDDDSLAAWAARVASEVARAG